MTQTRMAEEEGIQPSVALAGSRQFSGLVTFATRPLLLTRNLERRRGIEPRTPGLQSGRSPLAVAARGTPGVIRTLKSGVGSRQPHHRQPGCIGAPGWIRTSTRPVLSGLPLPVGLRAHW